jgi:hypothetical protein
VTNTAERSVEDSPSHACHAPTAAHLQRDDRQTGRSRRAES